MDLLYPEFVKKDQQAIRAMYKTFAKTQNPLPKDRNLIDYGFEDFEVQGESDEGEKQ